jgi:hypothetical protein
MKEVELCDIIIHLPISSIKHEYSNSTLTTHV